MVSSLTTSDQSLPEGLRHAREKMRAAGVSETAINVFTHYYEQLEHGQGGVIREQDIRPLDQISHLDSVDFSPADQAAALARTALVKLNGGLGTSMGMDRAKSLLPVRDGKSFLDLTVEQVLAARQRYGARLPLIFMNSFATVQDTRAALAAYPQLAVEGVPLDFLQSQEPKLRADDLTPVQWPADPDLEWCPPGHGDVYPSLFASGVLDALLDAGFTQLFISNSDNLGAGPSARIAAWFAASGAPYAAELCERTPMDLKGGHLAVRSSDGRIVLRETAQTAPEEMHWFTDPDRHPYFHTNNLWLDVARLKEMLASRGGVLGLPLIRNAKTVDPRDPASTPVIQIESAMGAAVELFDGATALAVPRSRFLPVKTTNELLLVRSDAFALTPDAHLVQAEPVLPVVRLTPSHYRRIADFEQRFDDGVPSLRDAESLDVLGDWTFGGGVVVRGAVELGEEGGTVPAGTVLQGS